MWTFCLNLPRKGTGRNGCDSAMSIKNTDSLAKVGVRGVRPPVFWNFSTPSLPDLSGSSIIFNLTFKGG